MLCMSFLETKQQWHTSHSSKSSKQSPKNKKFQGKKHPTAPLYTEAKMGTWFQISSG